MKEFIEAIIGIFGTVAVFMAFYLTITKLAKKIAKKQFDKKYPKPKQ